MCQIVSGVYRPRASPLWRCAHGHFGEFLGAYEERYQGEYDFLRPVIPDVVNRFMACGDPTFGFARIRCDDCGATRLLAFSCKGRYFCPSCHAKKVQLFDTWSSIRTSTRWWSDSCSNAVCCPRSAPGCSWAGRIRDFPCIGAASSPRKTARGWRNCLYILRNPFSVAKMRLTGPDGTVFYQSRMNPKARVNFAAFKPADFLAAVTQHIPDGSFHLVRYYGWYSNKMRGQRTRRAGHVRNGDDADAPEPSTRTSPHWRRLIRKVYEADPLLCPDCGGLMRVVSLVDPPMLIDGILRGMGIWDPPPSQPCRGPPEMIGEGSTLDCRWPGCYAISMVGPVLSGVFAVGSLLGARCAGRAAESNFLSVPFIRSSRPRG